MLSPALCTGLHKHICYKHKHKHTANNSCCTCHRRRYSCRHIIMSGRVIEAEYNTQYEECFCIHSTIVHGKWSCKHKKYNNILNCLFIIFLHINLYICILNCIIHCYNYTYVGNCHSYGICIYTSHCDKSYCHTHKRV